MIFWRLLRSLLIEHAILTTGFLFMPIFVSENQPILRGDCMCLHPSSPETRAAFFKLIELESGDRRRVAMHLTE